MQPANRRQTRSGGPRSSSAPGRPAADPARCCPCWPPAPRRVGTAGFCGARAPSGGDNGKRRTRRQRGPAPLPFPESRLLPLSGTTGRPRSPSSVLRAVQGQRHPCLTALTDPPGGHSLSAITQPWPHLVHGSPGTSRPCSPLCFSGAPSATAQGLRLQLAGSHGGGPMSGCPRPIRTCPQSPLWT